MSDAKSGLTQKEQAERVRDLLGQAIESQQANVKVNIYDESGKILDIVPSLSLDIVKDRELSIDLKIAHKSSVFQMDDSQHAEPDLSETQPASEAFQESARTAKAVREAEESRNRERVLEHEKDSATGILSIHLGRTVHYPSR
jgi:hypothetical protein